MAIDTTVTKQLAWLVRAHGTKPRELAQVTGRSRQLVYRWLDGSRGISDEDLGRIAEHYGVSPAFLRYGGAHVDREALAQITAGILDALRDERILSKTSHEAVGQLVAWAYDRYAAQGHPPTPDEMMPLIRIIESSSRQ